MTHPLKDGCFRLLAVMVHRYSREPETRAISALHMVRNAVRLMAAETSIGEASMAASEAVTDLIQEERRDASTKAVVGGR